MSAMNLPPFVNEPYADFTQPEIRNAFSDEVIAEITAAFTDVGSLWGLDNTGPGVGDDSGPRAAAGVGVAWTSPFGPIRIDFAKALLKQDYDDEELIRFSFGTRF